MAEKTYRITVVLLLTPVAVAACAWIALYVFGYNPLA